MHHDAGTVQGTCLCPAPDEGNSHPAIAAVFAATSRIDGDQLQLTGGGVSVRGGGVAEDVQAGLCNAWELRNSGGHCIEQGAGRQRTVNSAAVSGPECFDGAPCDSLMQ